jgi:hypothetical protein
MLTAPPECPCSSDQSDRNGHSVAEVGTSEGITEWLSGEVQGTWLSYEANPFNGKPFFNEVGASLRQPLGRLVQANGLSSL